MKDINQAERHRLREETRKAIKMIREALEEHAPKGSIPQQEFLGDFREEAQVIVDALKRLVSRDRPIFRSGSARPSPSFSVEFNTRRNVKATAAFSRAEESLSCPALICSCLSCARENGEYDGRDHRRRRDHGVTGTFTRCPAARRDLTRACGRRKGGQSFYRSRPCKRSCNSVAREG